jgi:hypothetical protein
MFVKELRRWVVTIKIKQTNSRRKQVLASIWRSRNSCAWLAGMKPVLPLCKTVRWPQKDRQRVTPGSHSLPLGASPKRLKSGPQKHIRTLKFVVASLTIALKWKQPKSLTDEWIDRGRSYSYHRVLCSLKKEEDDRVTPAVEHWPSAAKKKKKREGDCDTCYKVGEP